MDIDKEFLPDLANICGALTGDGHLQIKDWRYIILSVAIMSVAVKGLTYIINNVWLQVLVGGFLGFGVYFACCLSFKVVDRNKVFEIINSMINHVFKK